MEKLTVVQVDSNGEIVKELFTGLRDECYNVMRFLVKTKHWPMKRLDLIYTDNRRFSSWMISYE